MEKYIKELGGKKEFILCINKADYLSEDLLNHWNAYFNEKEVTHIFISAKNEQDRLDEESEDEEEYDDEIEEPVEDEEEKEFEPLFGDLKKEIDHENELRDEGKEVKKPKKKDEEEDNNIEFNTSNVYTREKFLALLQTQAKSKDKTHDEKLMVGMVGYPNVGKSSLINVLCGRKRVGVAAMPGKTKHFQTLNLEFGDHNICLVDCPGLVFPSFANSKAEMYCCGVLPIQMIKEYVSPVTLILSRVPKRVLEAYYKLKMPPRNSPKYTTNTFLSLYALKKGWVTGNSNPNIA
mmetsp:Transcript_33445/g.51349  ORF Transcript_33445/g.51349 Transcript_33445/m.51349 type:complete len:292 (-) Transcript_33445:611-1486(-)